MSTACQFVEQFMLLWPPTLFLNFYYQSLKDLVFIDNLGAINLAILVIRFKETVEKVLFTSESDKQATSLCLLDFLAHPCLNGIPSSAYPSSGWFMDWIATCVQHVYFEMHRSHLL